MKSRSWVWKYFSISSEDSSIAICSICKLKITRGNKEKKWITFNTINILCHINTKHKKIENKELNVVFSQRTQCFNFRSSLLI